MESGSRDERGHSRLANETKIKETEIFTDNLGTEI